MAACFLRLVCVFGGMLMLLVGPPPSAQASVNLHHSGASWSLATTQDAPLSQRERRVRESAAGRYFLEPSENPKIFPTETRSMSMDTAMNLSSSGTSGAGQGPQFMQSPSIEPVSGVQGTPFVLKYGSALPQTAQMSAILTLNGADVTQDIGFGAQGLQYLTSEAGPTGLLVWTVSAASPEGTTSVAVQSQITARTTQISMGGVTFTLEGDYDVGLDVVGKAFVVVPDGTATVIDVTPAQNFFEGAVIHGMMKNPQRTQAHSPDHGYDGRFPTYDAALGVSLPVSVSSGDVLIKTIAKTDYENRKGAFEEIAALHVVSARPPAGAILSSSVGWEGRATPEWYNVDIDAFYAQLNRHNASEIDFPPFEVLMQALDQFYPLYAQFSSPVAASMGYENASPAGFGGGLGNYGRYNSGTTETAMLALVSDAYSEAQTKAIMRRLVQHGVEWGDPMIYGPANFTTIPDGGHHQFHQGPVALALALTGRGDEISELMTKAAGNWAQAFEITAARRAEMADPDGSYVTRARTLGPQPSGQAVRLDYSNGFGGPDWYQTWVPAGSRIIRASDGTSAVITEDTALAARTPATGVLDVPIDVSSPFVAGDVVALEFPQDWVAEGLYDWTLKGLGHPYMFSPTARNEYRSLQSWGAIMALKSMGLAQPNMAAVEGYMTRAALPASPSAANDYPAPVSTYVGTDGEFYAVSPAFLDQYWPSLSHTEH